MTFSSIEKLFVFFCSVPFSLNFCSPLSADPSLSLLSVALVDPCVLTSQSWCFIIPSELVSSWLLFLLLHWSIEGFSLTSFFIHRSQHISHHSSLLTRSFFLKSCWGTLEFVWVKYRPQVSRVRYEWCGWVWFSTVCINCCCFSPSVWLFSLWTFCCQPCLSPRCEFHFAFFFLAFFPYKFSFFTF